MNAGRLPSGIGDTNKESSCLCYWIRKVKLHVDIGMCCWLLAFFFLVKNSTSGAEEEAIWNTTAAGWLVCHYHGSNPDQACTRTPGSIHWTARKLQLAFNEMDSFIQDVGTLLPLVVDCKFTGETGEVPALVKHWTLSSVAIVLQALLFERMRVQQKGCLHITLYFRYLCATG